MKKLIILLSAVFVFSLPESVFAQSGFKQVIHTNYPVGDVIPSAVCGPNDEVHVLVSRSTDSISVFSKKAGDATWPQPKGLGAAYDSGTRKLPVIRMSSNGYGCIIGQSFNQTYISFKTPVDPWTTAQKLGDLPTPFNSTNFEDFDCAVNSKGEVLAVWRDDNNLKESFKASNSSTFVTTQIKTGLKTATEKPNVFNLALLEDSSAKLFYLGYQSSGDTGRSMKRSAAGVWQDDADFAPLRSGRYFISDLEYDSSSGKALIGIYYGIENNNFAGAGYYYSIFDLPGTPQFTFVGPVGQDNVPFTYGNTVSARTVNGVFLTALPFTETNQTSGSAKVKINNTDFLLNSIVQEADPKIFWQLGGMDAALTGANSVVALSSKIRSRPNPENSLGVLTSSELKATLIKNGQKTESVILTSSEGDNLVSDYSSSVAECSSGNATAAFLNISGELSSIDYINDPATDTLPTPGADPDGSSNDACPNDVNKLEAGVCGCGVADVDSNADTIIDCGTPRAFVNKIIPIIVSATPNGKGKLNVQLEGLTGAKLKYIISVKGPKGYKKDFNAKKLLAGLSKLPKGTLTLKLKVTQKVGKKTLKSKPSQALKVELKE